MSSRIVSFAWVVVAYLVALAVAGWGAHGALGEGWIPFDGHPLAVAAVADLIATVVVFGFSMGLRNSSVYDPYWSVAPIPIVVWWMSLSEASSGDPTRQGLVLGLLLFWSVRLTWNWASGWSGLHHEDWRYVKLAAQTGAAWPVVSFLGVHLMPTVLVYLGVLAAWPALVGPAELGVLDAVAGATMLGAVIIEGVADWQLRRFARRRTDSAAVMTAGLWGWSRHPNYLGEIGVWLGLFLFALAADPTAWWSGVGVLAMIGLFVGISIPMMERRMRDRRPDYAEVQERIPMLLPWPRRRGA